MAKEKSKNKKMTLDGLAVLMKQGFGMVDKKFGAIDKKLEANQESMAVMVKNAFQGNQEYMDKKFGAIDGNLNSIAEEFRGVHYKLDKIDKKLEGQEKTIFDHNQKIDRIEVELKLKKA